ncbi:hypothetical protein GGX14DRAFT_558747 [Mycena pura]|uniref:MULE transposase domain-containing protein n=1 Tax=Mycena pura TaxID=153505 RepID=A0AAD6YKL9_9AGAR|nr:hypothetical protein GGX14DRAFT_558747 [Mycena pura]
MSARHDRVFSPSCGASHFGKPVENLSWKRDDVQLVSAAKLLAEFTEDVDVFDLRSIPEGVEILAWDMKKIAGRLSGKIVEITMDATYNTNARQSELYGVLAEYDNAGFPLAYCLLSTTSSVAIGKRTLALTVFGVCLRVRDKYGVRPEFTHVDKDMAEIGMLKTVWNPKISQCWWHVNDAVSKRLRSGKLATTPYDSRRAHAEYSFIDVSFVPPGKPDPTEFEGDLAGESVAQPEPTPDPSRLTFRLPPPAPAPPKEPPRLDGMGNPVLRIPPLPIATVDDIDVNMSDAEQVGRRIFCRVIYREPILTMMKAHAFAHPLIPGYCAPSQVAIKFWAVKQTYKFCAEHDLHEVWAYLWENWYRAGRWELWVLTTIGSWRRIKHDFLHHFHSPRVDVLVWILITKLAPTYYRKLDNLLIDTGRSRELSSWRKTFKSEWRNLEKRQVNDSRMDLYRPNVRKWRVHPVDARFFQQAERSRTTPFWEHPLLVPLPGVDSEAEDSSEHTKMSESPREDHGTDPESDDETPIDEDEDDEIARADETWAVGAATFDEELTEIIETLRNFAIGLEYQMQFKEGRMLEAIKRHGGGMLRLAQECLEKEHRANTNRGTRERTWENSSTMFYYPRPTGDRAT